MCNEFKTQLVFCFESIVCFVVIYTIQHHITGSKSKQLKVAESTTTTKTIALNAPNKR